MVTSQYFRVQTLYHFITALPGGLVCHGSYALDSFCGFAMLATAGSWCTKGSSTVCTTCMHARMTYETVLTSSHIFWMIPSYLIIRLRIVWPDTSIQIFDHFQAIVSRNSLNLNTWFSHCHPGVHSPCAIGDMDRSGYRPFRGGLLSQLTRCG